jgi:hypothetical protein
MELATAAENSLVSFFTLLRFMDLFLIAGIYDPNCHTRSRHQREVYKTFENSSSSGQSDAVHPRAEHYAHPVLPGPRCAEARAVATAVEDKQFQSGNQRLSSALTVKIDKPA